MVILLFISFRLQQLFKLLITLGLFVSTVKIFCNLPQNDNSVKTMEGANDGHTKLNAYLEKLRRKESVDGIPDKLLGNEDSDILTLLHSFDKTVDDGFVCKACFDKTFKDIKKTLEAPYLEAKRLKSSAAVDHHVTDYLNGIGLFPIHLHDSQKYIGDLSGIKCEKRAVEYKALEVEFYEFVEALRWTYDAAAIDALADREVLPDFLLTEDALEVYRSITRGRIGNLLLDGANLKFWNNTKAAEDENLA